MPVATAREAREREIATRIAGARPSLDSFQRLALPRHDDSAAPRRCIVGSTFKPREAMSSTGPTSHPSLSAIAHLNTVHERAAALIPPRRRDLGGARQPCFIVLRVRVDALQALHGVRRPRHERHARSRHPPRTAPYQSKNFLARSGACSPIAAKRARSADRSRWACGQRAPRADRASRRRNAPKRGQSAQPSGQVESCRRSCGRSGSLGRA